MSTSPLLASKVNPDLTRFLFDQSRDALFLCDAGDFTVLVCNQEAQSLFKCAENELLGLSLAKLIAKDCVSDFTAQLGLIFSENERQVSTNVRVNRNDGSALPVDAVIQLVGSEKQELAVSFRIRDPQIVTTDRTVSKTHTASVNQGEVGTKQFRELLNDIDAIIWESDLRDCKLTYVSDNVVNILGYTAESWLRDPQAWLECIHDEDRQWVIDYCQKHSAAGEDHDMEYRAVTADGRIVWLHDKVCVVKDDAGTPIKLRGIIVDVTEKKATEEKLRLRNRAMASAKFGIVIVDANQPDQPIVYCNPAFEALTGYDRDDIIGQNCRFLQADDNDQEGVREIRQAISDGVECNTIVRNYRSDGSLFWNELNISPVHDEHGRLTHFIGFQHDVTDRIEIDRQLRVSEQRFRTVFEQAAVGVGIVDSKTGRIAKPNKKYCEMLGYTAQELSQLTYMDITYPDDLAEDLENMKRLDAGEIASFSMEKRLIRKDGTPIWVNLTVSPAWTDSQQQKFHIPVIEDISDRKVAEAALKESEQRFRNLCEQAPVGIFMNDGDGNCTFTNALCDELTGLTSETSTGENWLSAVHPDDRDRIAKQWNSAVTSCAKFEAEYRYHTETVVTWVYCVAVPRRDETGASIGHIGSLTNITKRKEAEIELKRTRDELRLSENKYRSIVNTAQTWIWEVDLNGIHRYSNPAIRQVLGYMEEELVGNPAFDFMHEDDQPMVQEKLGYYVSQRKGWNQWLIRWKHKDGSVRYLESNSVPIFDDDDNLIGYRGADRDVTERTLAAEQRLQHQQTLAHVSRLSTMGEMMAGIAHEINQPLSAISNYAAACASTLEESGHPFDFPMEDWMRKIGQQALRCGDIIRRMRGFATKKDGKREYIDLKAVVQESLELILSDSRTRSITVTHQLPQPNVTVCADEIQLQQVLVNLLLNACDAANEVDPKVTIEANVCDTHARLSIRDNGNELTQEQRDRIFEPFFTTKQDGVGMGLAISKSIVEAHQGRLWLDEDATNGTAFHVELPLATPTEISTEA